MSSAQPLHGEESGGLTAGLEVEWDGPQSGGNINDIFARIEKTVPPLIGNSNQSDYAQQTVGPHTPSRHGSDMGVSDQVLIRNLKSLRQWKDWSQRELERMRKEIETLKATSAKQEAEIKGGKESYRALLDENVALKEQLLVSCYQSVDPLTIG